MYAYKQHILELNENGRLVPQVSLQGVLSLSAFFASYI